ncbi:YdbC family protein [Brucepastera parasyntrophica]|uniref:YdbC family protein n=1 Tax=Brucepastera parasyntrophica TaxID=2880008 RepID=UPI00210D4D03|nr:YdbC family protein [Brucepastera parasyntrophica]ULQ59356.1 YdbC family protein [Brucepastera parasyntrophica]
MSDEFSYEIVKNFGSLSESKSGWKMEVNSVSWGGRPAKYDIRSWSPDHKKMGKGLTLTQEELIMLRNLLNEMEI